MEKNMEHDIETVRIEGFKELSSSQYIEKILLIILLITIYTHYGTLFEVPEPQPSL